MTVTGCAPCVNDRDGERCLVSRPGYPAVGWQCPGFDRGPWGCWRDRPLPHPFDPEIRDIPCVYGQKLTDRRCKGCYRAG